MLTLEEAAEYGAKVMRRLVEDELRELLECPSLYDVMMSEPGTYCVNLHGRCEFVVCDKEGIEDGSN